MSKDRIIKPNPKPNETKGFPASNPPKPQTGSPSSPPPQQPIQTPKNLKNKLVYEFYGLSEEEIGIVSYHLSK
ncbi:MAG: hypothetical protein WKG06_23200 [Segetibacter sp.]